MPSSRWPAMWAVKLERAAMASGPTSATPAHSRPACQASVRHQGHRPRGAAARSAATWASAAATSSSTTRIANTSQPRSAATRAEPWAPWAGRPTTASTGTARDQPPDHHGEQRRADPGEVVGPQLDVVADLVDAQHLVEEHPVQQLEDADADDDRPRPPGPPDTTAAAHVGEQEQSPDRDEPAEGVEERVGQQGHLRR